jgi:hypothetical protein
MRRLIVIAARGLVVKPAAARPKPQGLTGRGRGNRPSFPLFDPRKRFAPFDRKPGRRAIPRIWVVGHDPTVAAMWAYQRSMAPTPPPADDGHVDGRRLSLRLEALKLALDDLPRQARRLVRARARRDKVPSLCLKLPMRPGRPPGYRKVPVHEVDHVLAECHALARDVLAPDTS